MSKLKYEKSYHVFRFFGSALFRIMYHPIILNKENIPKDGPVIICCNHEHKFDQYPIVCATNRYIRWVAKEEYKKNPFYRFTGCIFVKRPKESEDGTFIKPDNTESNNECYETLDKNGAIGIFPEGTRNRLWIAKRNLLEISDLLDDPNLNIDKELLKQALVDAKKELEFAYEDLKHRNIVPEEGERLLPFKPGAIKFAKHANATILPVAVTGLNKNKHLKFMKKKNRVIVSFGKPFKVNTMSEEEALKRLHSEIMEQIHIQEEYIRPEQNKEFKKAKRL